MATFGAPLSTGRECRDALAAAREVLEGAGELVPGQAAPPLSLGPVRVKGREQPIEIYRLV